MYTYNDKSVGWPREMAQATATRHTCEDRQQSGQRTTRPGKQQPRTMSADEGTYQGQRIRRSPKATAMRRDGTRRK